MEFRNQEACGLRLWPAWLLAVVQAVALVLSVVPSIQNLVRFVFMMAVPALVGLLFALWLLLASRLRGREKLGLAAAGALGPALSALLSVRDPALQTTLFCYGVPLAVFLLTGALTAFGRQPHRAALAALALALGWSPFPLLRNEGFDGSYWPEFAWRWSSPSEAPAVALTATPEIRAEPKDAELPEGAVWPQFRGPEGNGASSAVVAEQNWAARKPKELWRIRVGAGWSSFAYADGRLYTQEQRGGSECVTCYSARNGSPVWCHADAARFSEAVSGAGPRSTPSVVRGCVYALGGSGLLTCLSAGDGKPLWQRNLVAELKAPVPMWGFSGSPLILGDKLIVYAGADGDNGLIAVDAHSGRTLWGFPSTGMNYTTARPMTLAGEGCVVFCDGRGVHALSPENGRVLWTFRPKDWEGPGMIDPQQISPSGLLVALGDGIGIARLEVRKQEGQWRIDEAWSSDQLCPSFNDCVVLGNGVFGFNQALFTCLDLATGRRKWQGGHYGFGQAVLMKAPAQIVVAAENGDAALLRAGTESFEEIARLPVLKGKTWNHPVVVGNRLFMRNGKVAVCLRLDAGERAASNGQR